jgi:hypothetical protein
MYGRESIYVHQKTEMNETQKCTEPVAINTIAAFTTMYNTGALVSFSVLQSNRKKIFSEKRTRRSDVL